MGLKYENYRDLFIMVIEHFGNRFNSIKMLELGCQQIRRKTYPIDSPLRKHNTTKSYFTSLGIEHISVDINNKYGSLKMDLSQPLNKPEWNNYFDCVTNLGTIEHIDQNKIVGQYYAFKTVHDCCKSIMIHVLPTNPTKGHCLYRYAPSFVDKLAKSNNYTVMHKSIWPPDVGVNLLRFVYKKNEDRPFMSLQDFVSMSEGEITERPL